MAYVTQTHSLIRNFMQTPSLLEPIHILLSDVNLASSRERRVARDLLEEYFLDSAPGVILEALIDVDFNAELIDWDEFLDWYEVNYLDQYDFQEHLDAVLAGV
jgi:hypothetical protein